MNDDVRIYFGDAVKALGSGKVGGYLVRFGTEADADKFGDFFDAQTSFGSHVPGRVDTYYHHAIGRRGDPYAAAFGKDPIGVTDIKAIPDGLWADTQLDMERPLVAKLYGEMASGTYYGFSSGSDSRLIKYQPVKANVQRVERWPINDVTLSPVPVDRRNKAYALKALIEDIEGGSVAAPSLMERSDRLVADAAELAGLYAKMRDQRQAEGRPLSPEKLASIKALADSLATLATAAKPHVDPARIRAARVTLLRASLA